jgi:H(+)-transporting ATP synthase, vacuolar type, subunit D
VAHYAIEKDEGIGLKYRSVMGVELPAVTSGEIRMDTLPYGLLATTSALDDAYVKFRKAKQLIMDLAETENAIFRLAYAIKKTQKRANALKNIVIPNLDATAQRIIDDLEEKEREEFVRLKVIKAQQRSREE